MINAADFLEPAVQRGFDFWSGVPCSFLKPFINYVISSDKLDYVGAASEGEAVGIAAGAHLAGRKGVVICQNSGLGNTVNPFTSLTFPFRIPLLLIVTHRGAPDIKDEPQHELMGQITTELLELMRIPWEVFPDEASKVDAALDRAEQHMHDTGLPYALLMKKGTVDAFPLAPQPSPTPPSPVAVQGQFRLPHDQRMRRAFAIETVRQGLGEDAALIATTGKIGRELFAAGHRDNQLYCVGSMGCASGIGLGVALASGGTQLTTVLDGDGAMLMKLGALATIGHYQPSRFLHVLLDNEAHESTGAQATVSSTADLALAAAAGGYRRVVRTDDPANLADLVEQLRKAEGPSLLQVKIAVGSDPNLGRPTITPEEVRAQFMRRLASG